MSLSTVPHSGTKPSSVRCSGCGQMDPGGQAVTVQCEDQPTSLQHCINPSSTFMLGLHSCPQCRPLMTTTVSSTPGPFSWISSAVYATSTPRPYQPFHCEPAYCEQTLSPPWPFACMCPLPPPLYWFCPSLHFSSRVGCPFPHFFFLIVRLGLPFFVGHRRKVTFSSHQIKDACILSTWGWWWFSRSVVSDSLWPHGLQPSRLLCPWDFPAKSTGVGGHFLLQLSEWLITIGVDLGLLAETVPGFSSVNLLSPLPLHIGLFKGKCLCLAPLRAWGAWFPPSKESMSIIYWKFGKRNLSLLPHLSTCSIIYLNHY